MCVGLGGVAGPGAGGSRTRTRPPPPPAGPGAPRGSGAGALRGGELRVRTRKQHLIVKGFNES